jgi:IS5 family transposase
MRRFAGIELIEGAVPDESTILRFRHLLERHKLTQKLFELVRGLLEQKRLLLKSGTIVDAAIIDAPPSTKNEPKSRDPGMKHGNENGRELHFGMKAHVGHGPQRPALPARRCPVPSGRRGAARGADFPDLRVLPLRGAGADLPAVRPQQCLLRWGVLAAGTP